MHIYTLALVRMEGCAIDSCQHSAYSCLSGVHRHAHHKPLTQLHIASVHLLNEYRRVHASLVGLVHLSLLGLQQLLLLLGASRTQNALLCFLSKHLLLLARFLVCLGRTFRLRLQHFSLGLWFWLWSGFGLGLQLYPRRSGC